MVQGKEGAGVEGQGKEVVEERVSRGRRVQGTCSYLHLPLLGLPAGLGKDGVLDVPVFQQVWLLGGVCHLE